MKKLRKYKGLSYLLALSGLVIGAANLSVPFHKELDWDTAFWLGMTRAGVPSCCLHPLFDSMWWVYKLIVAIVDDYFLGLQLFFLLFLVMGALLYGICTSN